jgi:acetylglutamate kinase
MVISKDDAPPEIIDLGKVGEVVKIKSELISTLEEKGFIPVIAPVGVDESGVTYNINADDVASSIACALKAKRLILLTDVPGIMSKGELISSMKRKDVLEAISRKIITGGMIPKVKCCIEALEEGVEKTHIIDGRVENSIILELFTKAGIGTEILK